MKTRIFTVILTLGLMGSMALAQKVVTVPDDGTALNEFVDANHDEAGTTYVLERDGYYLLRGSIGVNGPISFVAAEGEGELPYMTQGTDDEGGTQGWGMFWINSSNISFEGIHISNSNDLGARGAWMSAILSNSAADAEITVNNCIIDFNAGWFLTSSDVPVKKLTLTNNLFRWNGDPGSGPWHGFGLLYKNGDFKEAYIENNTWVDCIAPIFTHENGNLGKFWFNHNTVVSHAQYLMRAEYWSEAILMNNLFVDAHFAGESVGQRSGQDPDGLPYGVVTIAKYAHDTLIPAGFPAEADRAFLLAYNANHVSSGVKNYWDNASTIFHDTIDFKVADYTKGDNGFLNSRALTMMQDDENYPYLLWNDQLSVFTEDPGLVKYTYDNETMERWGRKINGDPDYGTISVEAGRWGIHPDAEFPMIPAAKDYHDLSYTNAKYKAAAHLGYPLGDLNWFPAEKALWAADPAKETYETIMASVKGGTFEFVDWYKTVDVKKLTAANGLASYPNPAVSTATVAFSLPATSQVNLRVYNVFGQLVAELANEKLQAGKYTRELNVETLASGMYFIQLQAGDSKMVQKMQVAK